VARLQLNITDVGLVELGDETNSPLRLNKRLSDISLISKRSDVYSYSFSVPDTKSNENTLQYYYQSRYNNHINIDEEKACDILIDGENFTTGKSRITSSGITDGIRKFTIQFSAGNIDWWAELKKFTLADLDWSGISPLVLSYANIEASWTNVYTDGFVFADIDRGRTVLGSYLADWSTQTDKSTYRPELFLRYVFTLIETKLGITFESAFLDSADFRKLLLTYFTENTFGVRDDVIVANTAITNSTTNGTAHTFAPGWFNGITTYLELGGTWADVSDPSSLVNTSGQFTVAVDGLLHTAKCNIKVDMFSSGHELRMLFFLFNVTDGIPVGLTTNQAEITYVSDNTVSTPDVFYCEIDFVGDIGKTYEIRYLVNERLEYFNPNFGGLITEPEQGINHQILSGTYIEYLPISSHFANGYQFNIEDILDNNITLFDLFNDISRIFNFYAETDVVTSNVILEPRNDFYGSIADAEEMSDRLDLTREILTVFNSAKFTRFLEFKYSVDSGDGNLETINKNRNYPHMSYTHDYGEKFKEGTVDMSLKHIAPTLLEPHWDAALDFNDPSIPIITARYWQTNQTAAPPFKELKKPRILNYVHATQTAAATGINRILTLGSGTTFTTLPAAVPFSGDGVTAPFNLSFDGPDGLVATYYDKIIEIIETGIVKTVYLFWDKEKYYNANFRVIKHFEEPEEMKGYWILESIEGYDPLVDGVYKTTYLQVVPTTGLQIATQLPFELDEITGVGTLGDIVPSLTKSTNAIAEGSFGIGKGLIATGPGTFVRGFYNEDAPGAIEILGNGFPNKKSNGYIIMADGARNDNPERMTSGSGDVFYEEDANGVKKFLY